MKSLKIEDYQLVNMNRTELVAFKEEENITMTDVLDALPQYKAFDETLSEKVEIVETRKNNLNDFLKKLRSAFIDDKIKYEESKYSLGNVSLKTTSFKANIKRVGKETGVNTFFIDYQSNGNYYISSGLGRDYELALHKIVTQESFEDLLNIVESVSVLKLLETYRKLQSQFRDLYDDTYKMYKEIAVFQDTTSVVVSDKIYNGKDVPTEELKDVYKTFKAVKEKVYQAYVIADEINGKYNK